MGSSQHPSTRPRPAGDELSCTGGRCHRHSEQRPTVGSDATLRIDVLPDSGPPRRLVSVTCPHGATRLVSVHVAGESANEPLVVGVAFVKHYRRHRCDCLRRLWRRHFGCELGDVALVRGAP